MSDINTLGEDVQTPALHPVMINGKWHCSACGCPEEIAIGRRKGPLGEKTMCGDCGKFYHRHRRLNDLVEYTTDPEYHLAKRKGSDELRHLRKRGGVVPSRLSALATDTPTSVVPAESPISDDDGSDHDIPRAALIGTGYPPFVILNPPPSDPDSGNERGLYFPETKEPPARSTGPHNLTVSLSLLNLLTDYALNQQSSTPDWLKEQLETTLNAWPGDNFGVIQRPPQAGAVPGAPPEWRIKCYDCPGMVCLNIVLIASVTYRVSLPLQLYRPGPGQTLENLVVHLRHRYHRNNVSKRVWEAAKATERNTTGET